MLTQIDVADVAGINGVPWDAVELPSQFMETGAGSLKPSNLFPAIMRQANHYQQKCLIAC